MGCPDGFAAAIFFAGFCAAAIVFGVLNAAVAYAATRGKGKPTLE